MWRVCDLKPGFCHQHVWRSPENNNMSAHENTMSRDPVERSQAAENVLTDRKHTYRLYPSLPNIDRYEVCVPVRSTEEKPHTAAVSSPDSLLRDRESEAPAASADVRMRAQILILEEQRQELLSINEKWAKEYRTMKQYYREKAGVVDVSSQLLKAEKEVKELRAQNGTLTRRGQHLHEEIRRLNEALEEAQGRSETLQDVWKHQAEVYKEDFLKERKDREKLKEKYLELEKKFRKVYNELRVLKPPVMRTQPPQHALECTCTHQAKSPNWDDRPVNQHHTQQRRCTHDHKL